MVRGNENGSCIVYPRKPSQAVFASLSSILNTSTLDDMSMLLSVDRYGCDNQCLNLHFVKIKKMFDQ